VYAGNIFGKAMRSNAALLWGFLLCVLSSCGGDYTYQIQGKLANLEDTVVYAVFERDDYKRVDTVTCTQSGQFALKESMGGFNRVTVFFNNRSQWITAYLSPEGGKISITGDARYPMLLQIKGGDTNNRLSAVRKKLSPLLKEYTDLVNQHRTGMYNFFNEAEITSRIINVNLQLAEEASAYIKKHPDEEASVVLISMFFTEPDDTRRMDELLALLDPELKNFYVMRDLEQFSLRARRTALGAEAPGFTVKDIYGKSVSLRSFPDKYLLLAFIAPWCDMCQTEDLFLDKVITRYPKEKLDILLISLDSQPRQVREVLAADTVQWNLVTDSAGQATMLLDLYNVNALPRCFLIDEEGKILLKTESGLEVRQTLKRLLDEKEEEEED
jgi:peroxiredoxin